MDDLENENPKMANHAWRKKPRNFAPKSRRGCKTCKIRRIKCDLFQPSCLKCQSTGRTCDGYSDVARAVKTENGASRSHTEHGSGAEHRDSYHSESCNTISVREPRKWHANDHALFLRNPGPFMILPATGSAQTQAMSFFEFISIKHLNEHQPCDSWRRTLMFFSQTVPSVRYAATALALVHRDYYLKYDSSDPAQQSQSLKDLLPDQTPLFHYNRAIQLLLNQKNCDSTEATAITLLVCYLFTCFDQLAGNYLQSMKHLRGGVEILRSINMTIFDNNRCDDVTHSEVRMLVCQVARQIRRLDMQAVLFRVDWIPTVIPETSFHRLSSPGGAFRSLNQAADHLYILIAQVMPLRNTGQQTSASGRMPPPSPSFVDILLEQLETWLRLFENTLQQSSFQETDPGTNRLITLLRLQHTTIWTLLSSYGPGREMQFDRFLPQFQQCVTLARCVVAAHEQYSGSSKPTFTPEIGIIPVLYIIGFKCRHPVVRREALSMLRRQPIREAVWDSMSAARVIERVIEIEEGGSGKAGMIQSMEQIAMSQRIETMFWAQIVNGRSVTRLDISYTLCKREGMHTESLMI